MKPMDRSQIILISDMHLTSSQPVARLDNAALTCLTKFEWLLKAARKHNAVIVQAGDMFDKPRDWYMLPRVAALLLKYEVPFHCVYGQHDTYMHSKENRPATSMGVLAEAGLVRILNTIPYETAAQVDGDLMHTGWALYGASWKEQPPAPQPTDHKKILVRHAPIAMEEAYVGHDYIDAEKTLERMTDYDIVLCGDVHRAFHLQKGDRHILNTGPMFRYSAEVYNFEHVPSFATIDLVGEHAGRVQWYEMPCAPAEEVLTREHIHQSSASNEALLGFMAALTAPNVDKDKRVVHITQRVHQALKDPNVPQDVVDLMLDVMGAVSRGAIHGTA